MGAKLASIYALIKEEEGRRAQMRLAMMTGLPSQMAEEAPDSPEMLAKFAAAFKAITEQDCPVEEEPCLSI